jgi:signal transduction histidine kinase
MTDRPSLAQEIRNRVGLHDHLCLVYDDPDVRARTTVPYLADGLERGEWCVAVGDREFTESVEAGLEAAGIDLSRYRDRHAFAVATHRETYLASGPEPGTFAPDGMLRLWHDMVRDASRRGFTASRVAGEPTWALESEHSLQVLLTYEALVDQFFASAPATGLCLYRRGQWPADAIVDILRTHETVVVGESVCTGNLFYEGPRVREERRSEPARIRWMLDRVRETSAREKALTEARDAALAANRTKDEFLAALSHELRTPLTSIVGWTAVLGRAQLPPEGVRKALTSIERNASAMTRIVNDLLDMSAMLAGRLSLVCAPIDARALVREAVETIRPTATEHRLALELDEPGDPLPVNADADRLRQCVLNLLTNAVKYTPAGGTVSVRIERHDTVAAIHISDTGVGISPDRLSRIFDRFWRGGDSPTGSRGGLGLGLAITRQLIELHGGRVSVASPGEGQGTSVTIELPTAS